ncbi:MAG: hypothetical protein R3B06_14645 [Kofleriaceae bacterium]
MLLRAALVGALAVVAAACDPDPVCLGDCAQPIGLAPVGLDDGAVVDLSIETVISIQPPLQGGFVSYVGVRAQNVHDLGGTLSVALRNLDTNQIVSTESRPATFELRADGWAVPQVPSQDLANLPVCPYGSIPGPDDFDAMAWRADITFVDRDGRQAAATATVRPQCAVGDTYCHCACRFDQTTSCP